MLLCGVRLIQLRIKDRPEAYVRREMISARDLCAAFGAQFAPGLLCLSDPERLAYQAYGLEQGNLFQTFLNPKVWSAISRSRKKGYAVEMPPAGQDAMQMAGTFIISKEGRVELPYYYDHIADHPPLDLLISGVLSTRWDQSFNGPVGFGPVGSTDKK